MRIGEAVLKRLALRDELALAARDRQQATADLDRALGDIVGHRLDPGGRYVDL